MNRVDLTRPDSPCLAGTGPNPVGVRTLALHDPARARDLTVELWYPAPPGTAPGGSYRTLLRDGQTPVTLHGRAARDAGAAPGRFPLVILSHGYPGNRFLMAHLAEALASRGYVVAAPDHPASTYDDQGPLAETLYHRPLDQRFLLGALGAYADTGRAAIIGYSMGGYGALVTGGAALAPAMARHDFAPPGGILAAHCEGNLPPPPAGLRAIIAIGPWGAARGLWRKGAFAALAAPLLVMAGSRDDTSNYPAMRRIAREGAGRLLTFVNAGHNAAAPIPAPAESHAHSDKLGWAPFLHYADAVWDTVRMNAIAQHFAAAFLDRYLKDDPARAPLLDPDTALGADAGFADGLAAGLRFEAWG